MKLKKFAEKIEAEAKKIDFSLLFFIILIISISFLNKYPSGYTFSAGDNSQIIKYDNFLKNSLQYSWQASNTGQTNISQPYFYFYYFCSLVQKVIGVGNMSVFFYLIFSLFSFFSFRYSAKIFFKTGSDFSRNSISFIYAFSPYLLYFYLLFGLTNLFLSSLIPLIIALSYNYFQESSVKKLSYLGIVFFVCNFVFGNAAFFISLLIITFLLIILEFFILSKDRNYWEYAKKVFFYYGLLFLTSFIAIIPQISTLSQASDTINSNAAFFDIKEWIYWASLGFLDILYITPSYLFNADLSKFSVPFGIIPSLLFIVAFMYRDRYKPRMILVLSLMTIIIIFLSNKGKGILSKGFITDIFSSNIILESLRSHDKASVYLPFFILIVIIFIVGKIKRWILMLAIVLYLGLYFSFFLGRSKYIRPNVPGLDYDYVVKIPQDYFDTSDRLTSEKNNYRILSLPWCILNSPGWVNYPKWRISGNDVTSHLFKQPVISVSNVLNENWFYIKTWNEQKSEDSAWILAFAQLQNAKYLIYHKDVAKQFLDQTENKISYYEEKGLITKIENNENFDLYRIGDENNFMPKFYVPSKDFISNRPIEDLPRVILGAREKNRKLAVFFKNQNHGQEDVLNKIKSHGENNPVLEYKKIDASKYRIIVHGATNSFPIVFSENFNSKWNVYLSRISDVNKLDTRLLNEYKVLDGNEDDQATKNELTGFVNKGWITTLGDEKQKIIEHKKWDNNQESLDYTEKYNVDFVSKNFQGTIQNDNLPDGNIFETWSKNPVDEKNHLVVNGYANSWVIDPQELCKKQNGSCIKNSDGSCDFEVVAEFWPQRLFYIGLAISGTTLLFCVSYLIYDCTQRKKSKEQAPTV